jgi:hypothetical protein
VSLWEVDFLLAGSTWEGFGRTARAKLLDKLWRYLEGPRQDTARGIAPCNR